VTRASLIATCAAWVAGTLLSAGAPVLGGSLFGTDIGDGTVAVAVGGSEDNPVLARQAEQIIEESLRRNDVQVLGRQGLDRLLEDELYKAVVANKSATALLEIKKKYETDVLFVVEVDSEAAPGIGLNWVGVAGLSGTAFRTETAAVLGSATSPPLGTTGYPSAIGETELAARQRAVQRATNGLLLRAALPNVSVPEMEPSVTPESLWDRSGDRDAFAIDVSPDSRRLAVLRGDGVTLHELATGDEVERWSFKNGGATTIAFAPDGSRVAAADGKGTVRLCTRGTPKCASLDAKAAKKVTWLRFDLEGTRLAAAGRNGAVLVWTLQPLSERATSWRAHDKGPGTVFFLEDGKRLVTTSAPGRDVRLWNAGGGSPLATYDQRIETGELVTADCPDRCRVMGLVLKEIELARFAPTGGVSGDIGSLRRDSEFIRLIDATTGREVAKFEAHEAKIVSLGFGPSSRFLASVDETGEIRLWDTERARELARLRLGGKGKEAQVRLSRDGRYLVANRTGGGSTAWALK
jgi:hypothetical protein